ncbi:MAG: response regulator [Deltaproteobacteria bacterium]|nr:response regulator [Deltaproteobacteria bacterium]
MSELKLLIVEDNQADLNTFQASRRRYEAEKKCTIKAVECRTLAEALSRIDNSFDGAIIDLKLDAGDDGNKVIERIHENYRIPIAILTGTPDNERPQISYVSICKKGEIEYSELFNDFFRIYYTGLTKILGGRGQIEKAMNKVFWDNILPQLDSWKLYVDNGRKTEKALLRFTLSHLLELLGDDSEVFVPEEMYIVPPVIEGFRTGSIVKKKGGDNFFIVLSPACDLALHDGNFKTERILVCEIEGLSHSLVINARKKCQAEIKDTDTEKSKKLEQKGKAEAIFAKLSNNTYSGYFHFLPRTNRFEGGIINFRKINSYKPSDFQAQFEAPSLQISAAFTKDIVARFSSYYARQGQPDLDFAELAEILKRG